MKKQKQFMEYVKNVIAKHVNCFVMIKFVDVYKGLPNDKKDKTIFLQT